jgi:ClpX C4-type zinc finger
MTADTSGTVIACCSFCLKPSTEVATLIGGPGVYICDECVDLCNEIIREQPLPADQRLGPAEHELSLHDVIAVLPQLGAGGRRAEAHLAYWVRRARSLGATWAQIGAALDMTRQSAWERFSGEE